MLSYGIFNWVIELFSVLYNPGIYFFLCSQGIMSVKDTFELVLCSHFKNDVRSEDLHTQLRNSTCPYNNNVKIGSSTLPDLSTSVS